MQKQTRIIYFLITTLFFIIFDVYFSNLILSNVENIPSNSFLELVFIQNTGAAFSILQNSRWFLILFSFFAIFWIIWNMIKNINRVSMLAIFWTALLISGICCNLGERIFLGYVRDFFKLNFVNFPVFNISDIFINLGVFAIVFIIIKYNCTKNNENNN